MGKDKKIKNTQESELVNEKDKVLNDEQTYVTTMPLNELYDNEDDIFRNIYLNCDIDDEIIDTAVYRILRYNRYDKGLKDEERMPIKIFINTGGGSVAAGFTLIDTILNSKTPIHTINLGNAYSMGLLIFIAGQKRITMPSSTFLLHDGSICVSDSYSKTKDFSDFEFKNRAKRTKDYVLKQTKIPTKKYERNLRREWYMDAIESKQLGVSTHIIGIDCDLDNILT